MARFLSAAWFEELERAGHVAEAGAGDGGRTRRAAPDLPGPELPGPELRGPELVVEVVASGAPGGDVRYQVVVEGARARVLSPGTAFWPAQVELISDYATLAGIAAGELSALDALSVGRARVSGDTAALSCDPTRLAGLDLLPPIVRASTTF